MEKRYQVFISSTFEDLKDERQAVLKAILEIDHMPAGMELFPASDEEAWDLIKDVINASDYYVLVIGGRYGSLDEKGIGYTEKEYDYAIKTNKAVVPLLHKNPNNLPREKTETDKEAWSRLSDFRKKVENNHTCVYWSSPEELKSKVIVGLTSIIKRKPSVGWVRADNIPSQDTLKELLDLRRINQELEKKINQETVAPPKDTENLMQGDDEYLIKCSFEARIKDKEEFLGYKKLNYTGQFNLTWNKIWGALSPTLINEASDNEIRKVLKSFLSSQGKEAFKDDKDLKNASLRYFSFENEVVDSIIIQLRALNLMKESVKPRSVKDTNTYWTLTKYGDNLMMKLRAIKRNEIEEKVTGESQKV